MFFGFKFQNEILFQTCSLLAQTLHIFFTMNTVDLIIIYLTCGAPFGVYYFYQQRDFSNKLRRSVLVTLFWFPFAFKLLHSFVTKKFPKTKFDEKSLTDSFEKKFAQILLEENVDVLLFDFRETFERYIGLTKAVSTEANAAEAEIFQITNHGNKKLATKLLNRRNRSRLITHQILARRDFLRLIEKIYSGVFKQEKVRTLTVDFVKLIKDEEALAELHRIFQNPTQSASESPVNDMESEVWNPIEPKQLPTPRKPLNFRTMSATAITSKPD